MLNYIIMTQENWGMILVRESYLLQNPLKHPSSETVATVIAHELAHNWLEIWVTAQDMGKNFF